MVYFVLCEGGGQLDFAPKGKYNLNKLGKKKKKSTHCSDGWVAAEAT